MGVKPINWRPWRPPPLPSKEYEVNIKVRSLTGLRRRSDHTSPSLDGLTKLTVEIVWKGRKAAVRRKVKRNYTKEEEVVERESTGVVRWDEEFKCDCRFSSGFNQMVDGGGFQPWEVAFSVFKICTAQRTKKRVMVAGPAMLNLADLVPLGNSNQELEIDIPLTIPVVAGGDDLLSNPSLSLSLRMIESKPKQEFRKTSIQRSSSMPALGRLPLCFGPPSTIENGEGPSSSTFTKNIEKVKSLTKRVSFIRRAKKSHHHQREEEEENNNNWYVNNSYQLETDSFDHRDDEAAVSGENSKDLENKIVRESVEYGSLVYANVARGGFDSRKNCEDDEGLVYFSNRKPEVGGLVGCDQLLKRINSTKKRGIFGKRLSFRSSKVRGEPLLKKEYGESGGDDIDFARRVLSSEDVSSQWSSKTEEELLTLSEFSDDRFAVGSWECREIVSRDGLFCLKTQVFFASIDQRHEKAAGESACTVLVAVFAHWLHSNRATMLTKSEFDGLIREGSMQWRKLCESKDLMSKFPDKHFDLDTVIRAGVCPIHEVAEDSFIGFFRVEGTEKLGFLHEAMSFDEIWDEIGRVADREIVGDDRSSLVYIVSWNDHFFVLKVDSDAYYIIDSLGERLFEGCNQAFMLRFDKDSVIERVPNQSSKENDKISATATSSSSTTPSSSSPPSSFPSSSSSSPSPLLLPNSLEKVEECGRNATGDGQGKNEQKAAEEDMIICKGKEACKEYIKSFLAAVPIRELEGDIKKGLMTSTLHLLHQRLQIEFHHTDQLFPLSLPIQAKTGVEARLVP